VAAPTPFYYVLSNATGSSVAAIESLFTGAITIPSGGLVTLVPGGGQPLFSMPMKYINGIAAYDTPYFAGGTIADAVQYYPQTAPTPAPWLNAPWTNFYTATNNNGGQPTANTTININPNGVLTPFAIQAQGALDFNGYFPVNGILGPLGTSLGLAHVIDNAIAANAVISGLQPYWVLRIPDASFSSCGGAYGSYSGCNGTGLYPYADIFTQGGRGSNTVQVMNTLNSLQFTPVPGGIY
jgi:hypothetical protein